MLPSTKEGRMSPRGEGRNHKRYKISQDESSSVRAWVDALVCRCVGVLVCRCVCVTLCNSV